MCVERAFGILKGSWRIIVKRSKVPFRNMLDLVATCIELYNLCIIKSDGFEDDWIAQVKEKLWKRVVDGEISEGNELCGESATITEVRRRFLAREDVSTPDKANDGETEVFLLNENEKENDLLREAIRMHD